MSKKREMPAASLIAATSTKEKEKEREHVRSLTREEALKEAWMYRTQASSSGHDGVVGKEKSSALIADQYRYVDVRELIRNEHNDYTLDDASIEGLAGILELTQTTQPAIAIETDEGLKLIDGERRASAHKLLGETKGEHWNMMLVRVFKKDEITEDEIVFMLNAMNLAQRDLTVTEKAEHIAKLAEQLKEEAKLSGETINVKQKLHELLNISERAIQRGINIERRLCDHGKRLLDAGLITAKAADALSGLSADEQEDIIQDLTEGSLEKKDVEGAALDRKVQNKGGVPTRSRSLKSTNQYIKSAVKAAQHAATANDGQLIDGKLLNDLKNLVTQLTKQYADQVNEAMATEENQETSED